MRKGVQDTKHYTFFFSLDGFNTALILGWSLMIPLTYWHIIVLGKYKKRYTMKNTGANATQKSVNEDARFTVKIGSVIWLH